MLNVYVQRFVISNSEVGGGCVVARGESLSVCLIHIFINTWFVPRQIANVNIYENLPTDPNLSVGFVIPTVYPR